MTIKLTESAINDIQEIISKYKCPYDFKCYKSGFEEICGKLLISDGSLVECVDEAAKKCHYCFEFGSGFLCTCPLRLYIARHFHK